eukprot:CAMPEP_0198236060 /NCGR_PEP_ID=MMETSP1446-20131203/1975_1 /TAXON_ID=1461542 ORGANISM="Unidentified sp, Strain CCMP2111" /NCGR_SAMPLE_ID=MMETSP1446 /ASSEMBLY_ACC=CAM_ASM_001112 /LENGTH=257 /DNA_ID=CAMNT_0043917617 /DNA_START=437 /DNA_END=1210 /DNA_ORIENTATION=-
MNWAKLLCLAALTPCLLAPSVMADSLARSGVLFGGINTQSGNRQSMSAYANTKGKEASSSYNVDVTATNGLVAGGAGGATGLTLFGNGGLETLDFTAEDEVTGAAIVYGAYLPPGKCGGKKGCGKAKLQASGSVHYHYGSGHPDIEKEEHAQEADGGLGGYIATVGAYDANTEMKNSVASKIGLPSPPLPGFLSNLELEFHSDGYIADDFDFDPVSEGGDVPDNLPSNPIDGLNALGTAISGATAVEQLVVVEPTPP